MMRGFEISLRAASSGLLFFFFSFAGWVKSLLRRGDAGLKQTNVFESRKRKMYSLAKVQVNENGREGRRESSWGGKQMGTRSGRRVATY